MPEFQDRVLKCVDCGTDFVFTSGEQQFYHEKDFKNEPKRCKGCKAKRQSSPERGGQGRVETAAVCSHCGRETTIPFKPTQGRPVFCRDCFKERNSTGASA
jgi:CxxC-x17-CxxC domain-containing protein